MGEDGTRTLDQVRCNPLIGREAMSHLEAIDLGVDGKRRAVVDYSLTYKLVEGCEGSLFDIFNDVKD